MEKILLVEDEADVAAATARTLRRLGYEIAGTAASGGEALRAVQRQPPSLVLLDVGLQGPMDGIEVAHRLTLLHRIPVVFLTAANDAETLKLAKDAHPYGYIIKPFEARNLHAAIEVALCQHEKINRRLKEARERAEEDFRLRFKHAITAMFQAGGDGEILSTNASLAALLGYESPEELAAGGETLNRVLNLQLPKGGSGSKALEQFDSPRGLELSAYRKDGSTIWMSGRLRVVRDSTGEVICYQGTISGAGHSG